MNEVARMASPLPARDPVPGPVPGPAEVEPRQTNDQLTPVQRRTVHLLIGLGRPPPFDSDLVVRIRSSLERRLRELDKEGRRPPLWLGKHRLNVRERCEGMFEATLKGEGVRFEHSARTAAGTLFHGTIEVDIATERRFDPRSVAEKAARQVAGTDRAFAAFWSSLDDFERAALMADADRHLALFRDSFPSLPRRWAPQTELSVRARLLGGAVVLSGTPDLVLGPRRRLVVDFKTGRAWPEHPEDMRFYALLFLLRTGVPPYRVATFFLDSGEWQAEDVTEQTLGHAADRVVAAAAVAARLSGGQTANLSPGLYCSWCPRGESCPASWARPLATGDG